MKVVALIPARFDSTRFPGKMLATLGGHSIIYRTYRATLDTGLFDDVRVVSGDDNILSEIQNHGGKVFRSTKEHDCGSDRIAEAAETLDADIIINVQGDVPFITKKPLSSLIEVFRNDPDQEIDLASLRKKIIDPASIQNPNHVKVICDRQGCALYFSRHPIPYARDDYQATYYRHIGIYAFRKEALLDFYNASPTPLELAEKIECIRYLENGKKIKMIETDYQGIEIDTQEDLIRAQAYLESI